MIQDLYPWKTSLLAADAEWLEGVYKALNSGLPPGFECSHSSAGMLGYCPFLCILLVTIVRRGSPCLL